MYLLTICIFNILTKNTHHTPSPVLRKKKEYLFLTRLG